MTPPGPPPAPAPAAPPPGQATGWVRLTVQGNWLVTGFVSPTVRLNGYPVATRRGENLLPAWAGPNRLDVEMRWMWTYGQASTSVDVPTGQAVPLWYCPPFTTMSKGAIGTAPQHAPDRWVYMATAALVLVAMVVGLVTYVVMG